MMNHEDNEEQSLVMRDLTPFFVSFFVYFCVPLHIEEPSLLAVILKCAPIFSLMFFVINHGVVRRWEYSSKILMGLIFCAIGDAFLLSPHYFVHGMVAFAAGHLSYIVAFGFTPLRLPMYFIIGPTAILVTVMLLRGLTGILVVGVPIYIGIISIMVWRATANIQDNNWTWLQLGTSIGSILFAISDTFIGIDSFLSPVPYAQTIIMLTYYVAQLGISLSVLEPHESENYEEFFY